jgi:hypothetical protein
MTTQAWILMTPAQKDAAVLLDSEAGTLDPRQIDNTLANNLGHGTLLGQWIAPARLLNDPAYEQFVPSLGLLPIHVLDSDTTFLPSPPVD